MGIEPHLVRHYITLSTKEFVADDASGAIKFAKEHFPVHRVIKASAKKIVFDVSTAALKRMMDRERMRHAAD